MKTGMIEVFVARVAEGTHPFFSGEPESIGFFSAAEIAEGKEIEYGGEGSYSYSA